jgi:two-component system NtrC family sensor kinase
VLDLLAYQLKVNNVELEKRYDARIPRTMADPHQLQQVFVNLANNACQAMASHAGRGKLVVETSAADGAIMIGFHDNGPGISKEHQRKIFDPFFTTKSDGTGLGLSITYGIIKEHGGDIAVQSVPEQGTSFVIKLPVTKPPEPVAVSGGSAPARSDAGRAVAV